MELTDKNELKTEPLPDSEKSPYIDFLIKEIETNESLSQSELYDKLELIMIERSTPSRNQPLESKFIIENRFILGQFYFEARKYQKAYNIFESIKNQYYPALYQMGVILYDDLLSKESRKEDPVTEPSIDTLTGLCHPNKELWRYGFKCMLRVAEMAIGNTDAPNDAGNISSLSKQRDPSSQKLIDDAKLKLIHLAQYNIGKAYFQGFGCKQADTNAEKWWLAAADDGSANGSVSAMTCLAFFYSRKSEPEFFDLKKAYYWHNEACGNGSLESQGALGAMYYFGLGCKQDMEAAYECLTSSSERGNIYSMALLCDYYYRNKFYIKAAELSKRVAALNDIEAIARENNCLKSFIAKGIALASFTYARVLDLGKGVQRADKELAKKYYTRSFHFDADICQLFQNFTTHEQI